MRKLATLLVAVALTLTLCACGGKNVVPPVSDTTLAETSAENNTVEITVPISNISSVDEVKADLSQYGEISFSEQGESYVLSMSEETYSAMHDGKKSDADAKIAELSKGIEFIASYDADDDYHLIKVFVDSEQYDALTSADASPDTQLTMCFSDALVLQIFTPEGLGMSFEIYDSQTEELIKSFKAI